MNVGSNKNSSQSYCLEYIRPDITLFTALATFCFMCPRLLLTKQYTGFLISQPKETLQCYIVSWNKVIWTWGHSSFQHFQNEERTEKCHHNEDSETYQSTFILNKLLHHINGVWPQTKPSFIPANSAFRASLSQLWSFTRALMYHISLCFSCMAVSGSQGSKGEIKQKLFKVWQGLESQNSLLSLQPYFYWGPVPTKVRFVTNSKKKRKRYLREDYWGFSWPFKPMEKKMFSIFTSWTGLVHT